MSELEIFNGLKKKFSNAEVETNEVFVDFIVSISEFANVYQKDMSSVKYELQTGEYWIDGRQWFFWNDSEEFLYTEFKKEDLEPESLKSNIVEDSDEKDLNELVSYILPWIEDEEDINSSVIKKVLWGLAMSKQEQLFKKISKYINQAPPE